MFAAGLSGWALRFESLSTRASSILCDVLDCQAYNRDMPSIFEFPVAMTLLLPVFF